MAQLAYVEPVRMPHRMRSVLIFGPKGGLGKTTLTEHLAVCSSQSGFRTLAIDCDPQKSLERWFRDRERHQAYEQLAKIDVATCRIRDWEDIFAADADYDVVIIDMPPAVDGVESYIGDLTAKVDLILIPTGVSKADWDIATEWMGRFRERGFKNVKFVMNKVVDYRRRSYLKVQTLLSTHGLLMNAVIPNREDVFLCTDMGLTTVEMADAKGSDEFKILWNSVQMEIF
jgi:chromosome partitioning protein